MLMKHLVKNNSIQIIVILFCLPFYNVAQTPVKLQGGVKEERVLDHQLNAELDGSRKQSIKYYYNLGIRYKNGDGVDVDYANAFNSFSRAAQLGDAQSKYAVGYMKFKGLGTSQDYFAAAKLFAEGAYAGRDNSQYFLGLCYRNGYGLTQNEDSAQYWLKKSAALGYKQAKWELESKIPENSNSEAISLVKEIQNAAIPKHLTPNQFIRIDTSSATDTALLKGEYSGYLIQYDWSGRHPLIIKKLKLELNPSIYSTWMSGNWKEDDSISVNFKAKIQGDSLLFDSTNYKRKDHYSVHRSVDYQIENAVLNMVASSDTIYLAGNINMHSPERNEPSKPIFIALSKTRNINSVDTCLTDFKRKDSLELNSLSAKAKLLNVYPNPFSSYINVTFKVEATAKTCIEMYNMAGQLVYQTTPQILDKGKYKIKVEPSIHLNAQTYLVRLVFDGGQEAVKVQKN